jgi:arylsulfatase A-like enzyme
MKTRRAFLQAAGGGAIAAPLLGQPREPPAPRQAAGKPNVLFILVDNLGYGELGAYGGGATRGAPTPRIDRLASEGLRLTNMNMEAQCTPRRSCIMTGRYAIRSGTHSVPFGGVADGLTQWEVTVAEALSAAGYATALFGKWHLGSKDGRLPNDQGFDEWYVCARSGPHLLRRSPASGQVAPLQGALLSAGDHGVAAGEAPDTSADESLPQPERGHHQAVPRQLDHRPSA